MNKPDPAKTLSFASPEDLSLWLRANHHKESELWIKIFKNKSGIASVSWTDVVIETLCWGWIDGVKKSLNDQAYYQRITPRKPRSNWSKRNTEHVERLISAGRMEAPGLVQVQAAKADGRWDNAYLPASETEVPGDFVEALEKKSKAKQFFLTLNKSSKYAITYGLTTAKQPETRQRRFEKFMQMLEDEEKPGFGFKKKT